MEETLSFLLSCMDSHLQLSFQLRSLIFHYSFIHANSCKCADPTCQGIKRSTLPSLLLWFLHFQLLRCLLLSLHTLLQRPHFPTRGAESVFPEGRQEVFQSPLGLEEYWKIIFLVSQNTLVYMLVLVLVFEKEYEKEKEKSHDFATHGSM